MKKNWWHLALALALTLVLLYFFFKSVEWREVLHNLTDVHLPWFLLAVAVTPVHLITRAIRWNYLLRNEKENISFYNRFAATAVGFTVTLTFPGRIGEIVRPIYLAQKENISKGFSMGTIVVERIFDIFIMCFLLGLFLMSKPLYASIFHIDEEMYSRLFFWGIVGISVASSLFLITLSLYFFKTKTLKLFSFFLRPIPNRFSERILNLVEDFINGLKFFNSIRSLLAYTLWSMIVWLGIIFQYWIFFFAYRVNIPYFFLFPYTFMLMIGASIPTPGMVGGFHWFSKLGMTSFYNIDPNLAVSMTIVVHSLQVLVTCLIGYVILWREGTTLFSIKKIGEEPNP